MSCYIMLVQFRSVKSVYFILDQDMLVSSGNLRLGQVSTG